MISCANPHTIDKLLDYIYQAQESDVPIDSQHEGGMKIIVNAENADLELTDDSGKKTKRKARMEIIIEAEQKKEADT